MSSPSGSATLLRVAAEHYLMSRDHHFEDVVSGSVGNASPGQQRGRVMGQGGRRCVRRELRRHCDAIATRIATPHASASDCTEPHETTEPAATIGVTAGSSEFTPVSKTDKVAGVGFEDVPFLSGNAGSASSERADCSSLSDAQLDQLAIAVGLVASMNVADKDRPAILTRLLEFVARQETPG